MCVFSVEQPATWLCAQALAQALQLAFPHNASLCAKRLVLVTKSRSFDGHYSQCMLAINNSQYAVSPLGYALNHGGRSLSLSISIKACAKPTSIESKVSSISLGLWLSRVGSSWLQLESEAGDASIVCTPSHAKCWQNACSHLLGHESPARLGHQRCR